MKIPEFALVSNWTQDYRGRNCPSELPPPMHVPDAEETADLSRGGAALAVGFLGVTRASPIGVFLSHSEL